jgi:glycerophosphoryl diester phosphodiesterase
MSWLVEDPIAHRGLYDTADGRPANSLAAFEAAVAAGFPCELDVQLTAHGELVVVHDYDLTELTGEPVPTARLTPDLRARLRLAGTGERIPTLGEVLARVAGRVPLLVELKRPRPALDSRLTRAVLAELGPYGGTHALASFDPIVVASLRRARPGAPVGQISGLLRSADPVSRVIGRSLFTNLLTRPDFVAYELDGLPSRAVSWWRRRGLPVLAWPVESAADEARARRFADNIIFSGFVPSR